MPIVLSVAGGEIFEDKEYAGTYVHYGVNAIHTHGKSHGSNYKQLLDKNSVSPVFLKKQITKSPWVKDSNYCLCSS